MFYIFAEIFDISNCSHPSFFFCVFWVGKTARQRCFC